MVMNKRGQVIFYAFMIGITIIILALALAPAIKSFTDDAMNQTIGDKAGLDCNNVSISNFDKVTCNAVDLTAFYFIGGVLMIGLIVLSARIIF